MKLKSARHKLGPYTTTYYLPSTTYKSAFTIVELLVVIVVIGILAAITIVSYTGISNKATVSSIQSELSNAKKQLNLYYVDHGVYPKDLLNNCPRDVYDVTDNKYCIKYSTGTTYVYTPNNTTAPTSFCITTTANSISYIVTDTTIPKQGDISSFGLVGFWALDNTTGMTDLSGNSNNGTANGGLTIGTAVNHLGVANKATNFDGADDYVIVTNGWANTLKGTTLNTITFWITWGARTQVLLQAGTSSAIHEIFVETYANGDTAWGYSGGTQKYRIYSRAAPTTGVWEMFTFVKTNNGNSGNFFINGVLQTTYTGTLGDTPVGDGNVILGAYSIAHEYSILGKMDNVRIYNRALSQTEVTNLYNSN